MPRARFVPTLIVCDAVESAAPFALVAELGLEPTSNAENITERQNWDYSPLEHFGAFEFRKALTR